MDQPLDLSQRDSEVPRRSEYSMDVEEPICSYPNCSCSLKHIMTLESPKRRDSPTKDSEGEDGPSKRSMTNEFPSSTIYHPKKRKIEMYNKQQQTIARSSSDNTLNVVDERPVHAQLNQFGEYLPNGDVNYAGNKDDMFSIPRSSPSLSRSPDEEMYMEQLSQGVSDGMSYRMRTLSESSSRHVPKKRHYSRNSSHENGMSRIGSNSHHQLIGAGPLPVEQHQSVYVDGSRPKSNMASATMTYNEARESKENELKDRKIDLKSLKAEMMREIDAGPDTDDIPTFRKKLFESIMKSAKSKDAMKKPGGQSALDYLITSSVLNGENKKPFVTKNTHLNQVLRGEKPGKLCLMDIVELQVEIGLA